MTSALSVFYAFDFLRRRTAKVVSRPEGRRTGCASFSDRAMDGESENHRELSAGTFASSGEAFSFGYFSLGQQRKVPRATARQRLIFDLRKGKAFALSREFISFDKRQKKRTKEKHFPQHGKPMISFLRAFSDSPSWLGRKTAHIHVRSPTGPMSSQQFRFRIKALLPQTLPARGGVNA